jgi:predicted nucleotidyltransferase
MLTEKDITHIIGRIVTGYAPLAVGTFGSYAMGSAHLSSDLDLFIVKDTASVPELRAAEVRQNLFGILHPLDIHVFTAEEWEDEVYKELSFPWILARQARLYHLADGGRTLVPSLIPSHRRLLGLSFRSEAEESAVRNANPRTGEML